MTCKHCDPANEMQHWNDYSHSTIAFVSYPSKYKDHAELVIRSLTREVGSQNITGSIDLRVPIEFCPFCGKDLTGKKGQVDPDGDGYESDENWLDQNATNGSLFLVDPTKRKLPQKIFLGPSSLCMITRPDEDPEAQLEEAHRLTELMKQRSIGG